jgi:WD40 repeat protein
LAERYRDVSPTEFQTDVDASEDTSADKAGANDENLIAGSRDGKYYLANSEEGLGAWVFASVAVHRASDGKRLAVLPHEWAVSFAAFSPESRWLVTVTGNASADAEDTSATALVGSTVRVWEVPTGRKVTEVSLAQEGGIEQSVLSDDGGWLATVSNTSSGRVVLLWPLWPELLRGEACKRLTRNLSKSEWETFVRVQPQRETCPGLPMVSE